MEFTFKKVGLISEAKIELKGLTVVGGYNDIGKSFIGKTIFSVVKAVNNNEQSYLLSKKERIKEIINDLSMDLRRRFNVSPRIFHSFQRKFYLIIEDILAQNQSSAFAEIIEKQFQELEKDVKKEIELTDEMPLKFTVKGNKSTVTIDTILKTGFDQIRGILIQDIALEEKYKSVFDLILKSVFQGEFNSKLNPKSQAEIGLTDNNIEILNIKVKSSKSQSFEVSSPLPFYDATFIESPMILNLSYILGQFLYRDNLASSSDEVSYYITDLIRKISLANKKSYEMENSEKQGLESVISKVINGHLYYDSESDEFIYEKDGKHKIKSINTASGVKTFGLVQLLYMSGTINKNTLLIIDEPEVHLHPEWQLKYAELITSLADSGIFVIVTSHSPYMIEALKFYSEKKELSNLTKFYVSGKGNQKEGTTFIDVTENLEPLFQQLALPMQKLGFDE